MKNQVSERFGDGGNIHHATMGIINLSNSLNPMSLRLPSTETTFPSLWYYPLFSYLHSLKQ